MVLEGLDERAGIDSWEFKLMQLVALGFDTCPSVCLEAGRYSEKGFSEQIGKLETVAGEKGLPIDSLVLIYDSLSYSAKCGRTGHHFITCLLSRIWSWFPAGLGNRPLL
jgi:DNA ligase (NAD+)